MLSPHEALQQIISASCHDDKDTSSQPRQPVLLVDTHGHAHLDRERHEAYMIDDTEKEAEEPVVVSLTCAVSESDWPAAVSYASRSDTTLFGLGVHPWYVQDLSKNWLMDLEMLLKQHKSAIVGEIGLCKAARFIRTHADGKAAAMLLQRNVFKDQMRLAAKLQRPVSVHCVKQHGVFLKVLKELVAEEEMEDPLPPAIGMHSFTGTAHHVKEILALETTLTTRFYFGFSHAVNVVMCTSDKSRRQGGEVIRAVPMDRLLAESDVHTAQDVAAGTAGAIAYMAAVLNQPLLRVAQITAINGLEFLKTKRRTDDE